MGINLPKITDEDIAWAVSLLGLPDDAFSAEKDGGARDRILKSVGETLDVSACPGSGKTTLLVAKLAILARNWPYRRKGMCVLSHTNVAKEEIEKRLGGTEVGQALLSYPHYIGTIHGFVNEFMALPWLRSKGYPIKAVDDDMVKRHRVNCLNWKDHPQLSGWLKNKVENSKWDVNISDIVESWIISSAAFNVVDKSGIPIFKNSGESSDQLKNIVERVVANGYHRYDEMFMWANDLIDCSPTIKQHIRGRFPLVFLDEVQDNSEAQSSILHRIFMEGNGASCRIRFGDSDQEIFDHAGEANRAKTDKFPSDKVKYDLPNSHRFGQSIANLSSPLSVGKMSLAGQGPKFGESKDASHAIFLVDEGGVGAVLKAYGQYLLSVFDEEQSLLDQMTFTAVGGVHRDKEGAEKYKPHNVSHYCAEYDPDIANKDPKPKNFLQYVKAGHRLGGQFAVEGTGGESFTAVERIAIGIINFSKEVSPQFDPKPRKRNHRFVLESLKDDKANCDKYLKLVGSFAVDRKFPSEAEWSTAWKDIVIDVVTSLSGIAPPTDHAFLHYQQQTELAGNHKNTRNNTQTVEGGGRKVNIRLGSIHSVKGETHTATLVLDTCLNRSHHFKKIFPWIKGKPKKTVSEPDENRLKLHYVAMTRPSHLICLAMKQSTLEKDGAINQREIDKLKRHGWGKIAVVDNTGKCNWL